MNQNQRAGLIIAVIGCAFFVSGFLPPREEVCDSILVIVGGIIIALGVVVFNEAHSK